MTFPARLAGGSQVCGFDYRGSCTAWQYIEQAKIFYKPHFLYFEHYTSGFIMCVVFIMFLQMMRGAGECWDEDIIAQVKFCVTEHIM